MSTRVVNTVTVVLFLLVTQASAATIIVDWNGAGNYTTIQAAINAAANGDTVEVWPGTYVENLLFPTVSPVRNLTLRSRDGPSTTIIDGGGNPVTPTYTNRVIRITGLQTTATVVEGFTIQNGVYNTSYGGGIYIGNSSPIIRNNWIRDNYTATGGGGIYATNFAGVIESNRIYRNRGHVGCGIRIATSPTGTSVVQNNLIYDNIVRAGVPSSPSGQGIRIDTATVLLVNNVIYGNTTNESPALTIQGGGLYLASTGTTVGNCVIRANGTVSSSTPNIANPANATWYCNDVEYATPETLTGAGNFNADPLFVNPASADFHISAGSPCIDAGDSTNAPATDFEGNARGDDPATPNTGLGTVTYYDVGAFERVTNMPPVALDDTAVTDEDSAVSVPVTANDTDGDGNALTVQSVTTPGYGTAAIGGDGVSVVYTPNPDYDGTDSFSYTVSDGKDGTDTATVTVTVNPVNDPPVADAQSVTTDEDTPLAITLGATDPDEESLSFTVETQPSHGTLSGTAPNLTYTPEANYSGTDGFTFTASDATTTSPTATVSITVNAVNDAPVANAQTISTNEDEAIVLTLAATDVENSPLTYAIAAQPEHGTLSGTPPNVTYTPAADYSGSDSFSFTANDGEATSAPAAVSITIVAVNDPPVAQNQGVTTAEDTALPILLVATDIDSTLLSYTVTATPLHGTLTGSAPNLAYAPATNYHGADSFTFLANDGTADGDVGTVAITITAVNDAPVAHDVGVSTAEDVAVVITLTASDVEGDALSYTVATPPAHGTLSIDGANATYTPEADYNGTDSFTFTASDGEATSNVAMVTISITAVNDAPVAQDGSTTTAEDTAVGITLTATDIDNDVGSLSYAIVTPPAHGTLDIAGSGVTYTPAADYNGSDGFSFTASDGEATSNIAAVTISIAAVNDAPVAQNQNVTTGEDTAVEFALTAADVESDVLTYAVATPPAHGVVNLAGANATYTPEPNYHGADGFTFTANDGQDTSPPAAVSISITAVNDAPVAQGGTASTAEDVPVVVMLTATDVDEGDTLTYALATPPAYGTVSIVGSSATYTPAANYHGADSLGFTATDGRLTSNVATVMIDVASVNDAPSVENQSVATAEDVPVDITLTAVDADGDTLTYAIEPPAHGTLTGTPPDVTYTPAVDFHGEDSFVFTASDGLAASAAATVTITISSVNDVPTVQDSSITTDEDTAVGVTLLAADADSDALTYTIVDQPLHGTLSGTAPDLTYAPAADFNGSDSFTFTVTDGSAGSALATVSISVAAVNDAPVAQPQTLAATKDTPLPITLVATDADGDTLSYAILDAPTHGTLAGSPPDLVYTPETGYVGSDSITFTASDGTTQSAPATVSLTIAPFNHPPVAEADGGTADEDTTVDISVLANDSDPDGDTLSIESVTAPGFGTATRSGDATYVVYSPSPNYYGPDAFYYTVTDGKGGTAMARVDITIRAVNDPPIANDQSITTAEDSAVVITLTATDADGDALAYAIATSPAHGTLSIAGSAATYTPATDYSGSDSFTFTAGDAATQSPAATVSITVTPANDAPVAESTTVTTAEDTAVAVVLTAVDVDSSSLTYAVVTPPAHGTLSGTAPNLTYTPGADYDGADSLTFTASDGAATSNAATVSLVISPVNDAPVADAKAVATAEDTALAITLTATDVDQDALTYAIAGQPAHGTLTGTAPNVVYTPAADYHGSDSFSFTAGDASTTSPAAIVAITVTAVNDAPVSADKAVTTAEDTPIAIALTATDVDLDPLSYTIATQPAHGTLSGSAPDLAYTPAANYGGSDSFTFRAADGSAVGNVATVSITVTPVNDAPVAQDQAVTTAEEAPIVISLVASDLDGDALTFAIAAQPAHGVLSGAAPNVTYTPAEHYHGADSFTFTASDGAAISNVATVAIGITSVNDAPVAEDQSITTAEDTPVAVALAAHDVDGDALTLTIVDAPAHGSLEGAPPNLTYTPAGDYNGADTFTFRASDGIATGNVAVVSITITAVNDMPTVAADSYVVDAGATLQIGAPGVLANDADVDHDPLQAVLVATTQNGALSLNADGSFSYLPNAGFDGTDSFTYRATDGTAQSVDSTVTIDVRNSLTAFRRSDTNSDGKTDIADAIFILTYLFRNGPEPTCLATADTNGDDAVDIGDAIKILGYLFSHQPAPPAPFENCGTDPKATGDKCKEYSPCGD